MSEDVGHMNRRILREAATARRRRPHNATSVVGFTALAYGFSWAWLIPLAVTGLVVTAGLGWPTHLPALMGPLLAAFVMTARQQGRRGVRDLVRRLFLVKVPARWWWFALSPLLLLIVVLLTEAALGQDRPEAHQFATFSGVTSTWGVLGVAGILLLAGFGEETGWRGYALPRLQQRHSPLVATVIVAALWVGWHAPMFLVVDTYRSFGPAILVGWIIALFCGAVVLTWLYNRSGGSIMLVAIWHAAYNLISGTDAATGLLAATSTTLVITLALTLVGLEIRASHRGGRSVLAPSPRGTSPDSRTQAGPSAMPAVREGA
jgi:membrane protease YdiL (CAAX protease family)